jgi:hypothetical protein
MAGGAAAMFTEYRASVGSLCCFEAHDLVAEQAIPSVISGDVLAEIKHLKDQPGRDIVQ